MKRITYVSYYARPDDRQGRQSVPACTNKMDSITEILTELGYDVEILSASGCDKSPNCSGRLDQLSDQVSLRFFRSFPWTNMLSKLACRVSIFGGLLFRLLRLRSNDKVIVYHSLDYMPIISLTHRIRRFKLILEVEEIYSDVTGNREMRDKEIEYIKKADRYLFPTHLLEQLLNTEHKPFAVIHGTYKVEPERKPRCGKLDSDEGKKIHCVYAGTFDPRKGGALAAAAAAAANLPDNYQIHIIGFGSDQDVENLKNTIEAVNRESKCKVSFDGLKQGEEYTRFIQGCDIGLSTQDPSATFNMTSFPSKILSYLANGLRVVSIRIPAIETSDIGDILNYYDEQTPKHIADAILAVETEKPYDSRRRIIELNKKFREQLFSLLEDEENSQEVCR